MQSQADFSGYEESKNPSDNYSAGFGDSSVMTTSDWFWTTFLLAIPLVNIVLLFVWGFGSSGNLNRRNFSRAYLIWMAIALVLYGCMFAFILAAEGGNF